MSTKPRRFRSSPLASDRGLTHTNYDWEVLFDSTENAGKPCVDRFDREDRTSKAALDLHLDLFNFEEPSALHSHYVLTSPRSLEACGRFGIKPVELLHKSFEEFVEEFRSLYDTDYSPQAVYEVSQEHERQRLRKLKLCRDERERIIKERKKESSLDAADYKTRNLSSSQRVHRSKSPTGRPDAVEDEKSSFENKPKNYAHLGEGEKDNRWVSAADGYHKRTTSPGHDQGKENLVDSKEARITLKPPSGKTRHSYVTTKSRSISPRGTKTYGESSDSEGAGDTFHPRTQNANDSGSTSSDQGYSPRASKKPSSARSVGKRDRVMKRVVSANEIDSLRATAEASLSQKDQRIVNLMMSRHEEQQKTRKERWMLELEMDEQRKLEDQLRLARLRQRQAEMYDRYKAKDLKQFEVRARRLRNEQRLRKDKEETLLSRDFTWQMERRKQEQLKKNKLLTKKLKDTETKLRQKENLWQKKREDELYRNMIQLNLLEKHKSVVVKKNLQSAQERLKIRSRNENLQDRHSYSTKRLGQQLREAEQQVRHEVAVKHQSALMNHQRQLSRKENQMAMSKIKREERVERQQEQLRKKNDDIEEWRRELTAFRKQKERRAQDTVTKTVTSKQQKVRTQLVAKKEEHLQNYERVKQADEERKRNIQQVIEIKNDRSRMVNTEKEEIRRLNRDAARTSQAVRDIVREQTLRRMAEAAQRQALVGRGPQTGHKNKSTMRLG